MREKVQSNSKGKEKVIDKIVVSAENETKDPGGTLGRSMRVASVRCLISFLVASGVL
jgi:hypothetical protein